MLFIDNESADRSSPDELPKDQLIKRIKSQIMQDVEKSLDNILKQICFINYCPFVIADMSTKYYDYHNKIL
ncbi:MAG: hypothetical protein MJ215_03120 [Spirochaetia bacterium]|nr:hypothetical protein [Spirochaetia bacterium]